MMALAAIVVAITLSLLRPGRSRTMPELAEVEAAFVGINACKDCHSTLYDR